MKNLLISFSGGRTSAYMAVKLMEGRHDYDRVKLVFANTGEEHDKTLDFVDRCDREFGLNITWVEAVVHPNERKSSTYKVVTYETASRPSSAGRKNGPFHDVVRKYGLPNQDYLHCTRELKMGPIHSFCKEAFHGEPYDTAIGIRADELDRVSPHREKHRIVYPLLDWNVKKANVLRFWDLHGFDLGLPDFLGNCVTCHKKSDRKLLKVYHDNPAHFDFAQSLEDTPSQQDRIVKRYRGHRTTRDLLEIAKNKPHLLDSRLADGCGETCEMFDFLGAA